MNTIYDIIGIGIGPFNLGMAALSDQLPLQTIFFDQSPSFDWHRGLMLEGSTLQVPFIADLVTSIDPSNKYSYLNYVAEQNNLFKFCIRETFYITRTEYNAYCQWVAQQLPQLHFSHRVEYIEHTTENGGLYEVAVHNMTQECTEYYLTKNLVIGTGTQPNLPPFVQNTSREHIFHTSQYLYRKPYLKPNSRITIVGSGQSAAEIFQDLLNSAPQKEQLNWLTDASRFFPMENSKLTFEHTSPDYVQFFHNLPEHQRIAVVKTQDPLYKGINQELIDLIYDQLYALEKSSDQPLPIHIMPNTTLTALYESNNEVELNAYHKLKEEAFKIKTDYVILATGYKHSEPKFMEGLQHLIHRNSKNNYQADANYNISNTKNAIYILNMELHSHGILTADLGMGPYRNAVILNNVLQKEIFKLPKHITFQNFDIPKIFKTDEGVKHQ